VFGVLLEGKFHVAFAFAGFAFHDGGRGGNRKGREEKCIHMHGNSLAGAT
jgi:hypothetical protein